MSVKSYTIYDGAQRDCLYVIASPSEPKDLALADELDGLLDTGR